MNEFVVISLGYTFFKLIITALQTFREIQRLLSKTNGKVIGDVMTSSPIAVRENTNLDAATRLLLETKYRRLPVVDSTGKLVSGSVLAIIVHFSVGQYPQHPNFLSTFSCKHNEISIPEGWDDNKGKRCWSCSGNKEEI